MYKFETQITIAEFISPFGKLDKNNRWVRIADMIPWQRYEVEYASQFPSETGNPAINFRMVLGTLIIKQMTSHSDEDVLQDIPLNPYMQFLIGLHEFTNTPPFAASSITNFRKYIPAEMMKKINEDMFLQAKTGNDNDKNNNKNNPPKNTDNNKNNPPKNTDNNKETSNKGHILLDATCTPAYIAYPTDINLLNKARQILEGIIDKLYPWTTWKLKPRTYRKLAR